MQIKNYTPKLLPVNKLKPYKNNPRNNEAAIEKVAQSIKDFGFRQPIVVDKKMVLIIGHTRLLAAQSLNIKSVPVIVADDLKPKQVKALRLADNKVGEIATWDDEMLGVELVGLENFFTGFDEDEVKDLIGDINFDPSDLGGQGNLDTLDPIWCECPNCGKEFDLRETKK